MTRLLLTCEHGGNRIPDEYGGLFEESGNVLQTHRGYDIGSFDLFNHLMPLADHSVSNRISRLLIEINRSPDHPKLFSEFSKSLPVEEKNVLMKTVYLKYWIEVENYIRREIGKGNSVIHVSVHTFTPELNGKLRNTDIGLLYDPKKSMESDFSLKLKGAVNMEDPDLKCRMNYPYKGVSDGLTRSLRSLFEVGYAGIEIEVNQKFAKSDEMPDALKNTLFNALSSVMLGNY